MKARHYLSSSALAIALTTLGSVGSAEAQTEYSVGGYVKLDAMVTRTDSGDLPSGSIGRDFYIPGLTPIGGDSNTYTDFHARESRIWLRATQTLSNGEKIEGYFELDFLGTAGGDKRVTNSYSPRMRQIYLRYGNWLAGQTWTNFQDLAILPEAPDFIGIADATVFNRQAQIRYTAGNGFSFALEAPESTVTPYQGGTSRVTTGDTAMPDITARYSNKVNNVHYSIGGIMRRIEYRDVAAGVDDTVNAFGINLTSKIEFGAHDLRLGVVHGQGLGRYVGVNFANAAVVNDTNRLDAIDLTSFSAAYRHVWNSKVRTNFIFSSIDVEELESLTGPAANKSSQRIAANLMYQVNERLVVGGEISRATREILSGAEGNLDRFQLSAQLSF
ncbi:DcaP family trimeric outer membrane transporter [Aliidiomarina celeris]|uniref:DcaP family trimeric outer membrane transporter n=1 Tax=Aliidiomarina celeris TaxID=2249428 RepID=UPI000DE895EA|nr:DcaP family trimeric outer membrane transporter [Aliidiomarina celeris]